MQRELCYLSGDEMKRIEEMTEHAEKYPEFNDNLLRSKAFRLALHVSEEHLIETESTMCKTCRHRHSGGVCIDGDCGCREFERDYIHALVQQREGLLVKNVKANQYVIEKLVHEILHTFKKEGKLLWLANGGLAGVVEHLSGEFTGRFDSKHERKGYPSIALTANSSNLTALANDYKFEYVFSHQVQTFAQKSDVVIAMSSSGTSRNVVEGLNAAKVLTGVKTVAFAPVNTPLIKFVNFPITINAPNTAIFQELCLSIGQIVCALVDKDL